MIVLMRRVALVAGLSAPLAAAPMANAARAAELPFDIRAALSTPQTSGTLDPKQALLTAMAVGVDPAALTINAEIIAVAGGRRTSLGSIDCGFGDVAMGRMVSATGVACKWPEKGLLVPPGAQLRAVYTARLGAPGQNDQRAATPVVRGAVTAYPSSRPADCAHREAPARPRKTREFDVFVYRLLNVVAADGALDPSRICVVATVRGASVTTLRAHIALTALKGGREITIGSMECRFGDDGARATDGTTYFMRASNCINRTPDRMVMERGTRMLFNAKMTFGGDTVIPLGEGPVLTRPPTSLR